MKTTVAALVVAAAALLACKLGDTKATVSCAGSARFGVQCRASHTGSERLRVCWKVRFGCGEGSQFDVPACAEVEPGSSTSYAVTPDAIHAAQNCAGVVSTSVVETTVTRP